MNEPCPAAIEAATKIAKAWATLTDETAPTAIELIAIGVQVAIEKATTVIIEATQTALAEVRQEKDTEIRLLKEQIRVSDVAFQHQFEQAKMWKANHDNQVELKRVLMDRPDLKERAALVMAMAAKLEKAKVLLKDVMQLHRDPSAPEYNECDKPGEMCWWCEQAKEITG